MTSKTKSKIEKRFCELAMKEAFGETSAVEHRKLEILQGLRRPKRSQQEIMRDAESHWKCTVLRKGLRKVIVENSR